MGNIAQKLRSLPNSAGVYQYVDSNGRVLYIGKAKNLKNRVKSYFSLSQTLQSNSPIPNPKVSLRIASMLRQVENIEILLVNSEQDALILENSLIKQLKPKYNILLRDDKTYPYIAFDLTKDFPLPCISRAKAKQKGVSYFGPFVSGAREIINSLLEMYPFVQKSSCAREKKSCLFYQIGRCSAPCEGKINKDSYAKIVEEAIILLKSPHKLLARLKEKMLSLSQSQQYEEASIYRDRIKKLQNLQSFSTLDLARDIDVDVLYFYISSNSPAGSHCIDLAVCHEARTRVKLTSCQTAKNSTSTTLRARIVDSSKQADSSENGNSSSLDKNPQDSRGNLTQNDKTNSPSLAEGVRGRVDSNAELSLQDSESERGKTRQSRSFFSNLNGIASDFKNAQLKIQGDCHAQQVALAMTEKRDCHESAYADSRNDEKTREFNADFDKSISNDNVACRPEGVGKNARSILKTQNRDFSLIAQNDNDRDISGLSPQYDKNIDSHAEKSDLVYNDKKQKTQKGILLSLFVRGGKIISIENEIISLNQYFANDKKDDKILLDEIQSQIYTQAILNQYSSKLPIIPSEILLPSVEGLPCELLSDFLHSTQGRKIALNVPQIGIKAKILALAKANAKDLLKQHTQKLQQETTLLECVAEMLNLDSIPHRIEVFDTSHHSGKDCVGAMIVYENGEFVKSSYRRYLLSGSDEYSQMREMLIRRAKDFATTPPPNLWLIDGGKAQIALANEVLQSCGLSGGAIDIVGIAKEKRESTTQNATNINEKMLTLSTRTKSSKYANRAKGAASDTLYTLSNSFLLNSHDELLQFLQKLRDEAHRFAIAFHREKKKTNALQSTELKKRNLNQAQVKRLLSLMGSFERVQKLSDEEIANLLKSKRTTSKTNKHK